MIEEIHSGLRKFLGTLFFVGYIPGVSKNLGALLMIALLWFKREAFSAVLIPQNMEAILFFFIVALVSASWLANKSEKTFGTYNSPRFILDIFLGQFIVFLFIHISIATLLIGFILYRFFGIIKPWPIYPFDEIDEGVGIVMDDVMAGVAAAITLQGILYAYGVIIGYLG